MISVRQQPREQIKLLVEVKSKMYAIKVYRKDKAGKITEELQQKSDISAAQQELMLSGKSLDLNQTWEDNMVPDFSVVQVVKIEGVVSPITFIYTKTGEQISLELNRNIRVTFMKRILKENLNIEADKIKVYYEENELKDENTLGDYRIPDNGNIVVKGAADTKISIEIHDDMAGKMFTVAISPTDKVEELRKQIESRLSLRRHSRNLTFKGKKLKDGRTLVAYQIKEGETIHVAAPQTSRRRDDIQQILQSLDEPQITVYKLKRKIIDSGKSAIPVKQQRLLDKENREMSNTEVIRTDDLIGRDFMVEPVDRN